jgi:hypothetical protein
VITVRDATVSLGNIYCPSSKSIVLRTQSEIVLIYQVDVGTALVLGGIDPDNETANTIYAGPASGAAAHPAFRAVADADIPATHSGSAHHTRSHTLTSASDHTGTADRVIYVDHAGAVQELALGPDGTVLTSTGAATAPAFEAAAGGGAMATDPLWDALGDLAYGTGADTGAKLAGQTTVVKLVLTQTGNGAISAAPAWGHPNALWDADTDTGIQVEEAADEDIIRFDTGGTQRAYLGSTGLYLANAIAVGPDAVFSAAKYAADIADYALTVTSATVLRVTGKFTGTGTSQYFYGLDLNAYYSPVDAGTATLVVGLNFMAWQASGRAISSLIGIYGYVKSLLTTTGTIATAAGMYVTKSWLGAKPTTAKGIKIYDMGDAACTTVYGLEIADQTAGTTSLPLAVGPNTGPYLKVVGGAAPGAGLTNVWINESGNVRQVQVVTADGGGHVGAGDLILKVV